jgi:1-deoxy-D-xylulose 5-phosphate reductoisomerase
MNKGLELEAYHLFPVAPTQLEVVVHPQSIVHALVEFCDGSMLAQLANPDMRTPIALSPLGPRAWPRRPSGWTWWSWRSSASSGGTSRFRRLIWSARPCGAAAWLPQC